MLAKQVNLKKRIVFAINSCGNMVFLFVTRNVPGERVPLKAVLGDEEEPAVVAEEEVEIEMDFGVVVEEDVMVDEEVEEKEESILDPRVMITIRRVMLAPISQRCLKQRLISYWQRGCSAN